VIAVPGIGRVSGLIAALALEKEQWELKKYHQPSDRRWNFDGMIEDAQLAMLSAWLTAQADAMPAWKPGDEFDAARKRALAAAGGS
jgi:hypothetical protein